MTTAALLAEVEAKEKAEGKTPQKTDKPKKRTPKYRPLRETKAVLQARERVYKMVSKVWNDPASKGLRPDDIVGYIRGQITAEKGLDKETDFLLVDELWDLVELWKLRSE